MATWLLEASVLVGVFPFIDQLVTTGDVNPKIFLAPFGAVLFFCVSLYFGNESEQ